MTENSSITTDPSEGEETADLAAQVADPARYALAARDRGAAARVIVARLAERFGTPPADDTAGGAI